VDPRNCDEESEVLAVTWLTDPVQKQKTFDVSNGILTLALGQAVIFYQPKTPLLAEPKRDVQPVALQDN